MVPVVAAIAYRGGLSQPPRCPTAANRTLHIVTFNASSQNQVPETAASWILARRPDIVVLAEAKGRSAIIPSLLARDFPYQASCARTISCSTMLLSRVQPSQIFPLAKGDVENRKALSAVVMTFDKGPAAGVVAVALHLSRPLPVGQQKIELTALADQLRAFDPTHLIVAGDFNMTAHNSAINSFARAFDLHEQSAGATWPTPVVKSFLPSVIAIDHILTGRAFGVAAVHISPVIGSDHRAIFAALCT